jgi:hypothetical protein
VSPSAASEGVTGSTLIFAENAKKIKNKAVINEGSSGTTILLKEEIKRQKVRNYDLGRQLLLRDAEKAMLIEMNPGLIQLSEEQLQHIDDSINEEDILALLASEQEKDEPGKIKEEKLMMIPFPPKAEESAAQDEEMKHEESQNEISTRVYKSIPLPQALNNPKFYEIRIERLQVLHQNARAMRIRQEKHFNEVKDNQAFEIQR